MLAAVAHVDTAILLFTQLMSDHLLEVEPFVLVVESCTGFVALYNWLLIICLLKESRYCLLTRVI